MIKIIVKKRLQSGTQSDRDFIAYIEGDKGYWGCGPTRTRAIGSPVFTHRERFNIELEGRKHNDNR